MAGSDNRGLDELGVCVAQISALRLNSAVYDLLFSGSPLPENRLISTAKLRSCGRLARYGRGASAGGLRRKAGWV
ncbi:hypothetical protein CERZMDRAFT_90516 [Cercospora zeae-maydis SCOH1-5]|uniref:Uncharacterized protein n=1 Tax=Cercospora zeae-maydis SCOH1-5 TaxID=717836 RepID=A0A6A6FJZ5_9PEZI|nr:hypothetical protein CERZMDRAFT_90516 [Cercospora zeae-maydis SCOH1-5]